jgi:Lipocalin-like domain
MRRLALVLLLSLNVCACLAKEKSLIGAWRLKSFVRVVADGQRYNQLGEHPDGYLIYSSDGRMSVLMVDGDRPAPQHTPPTVAERAALHETMLAYAGTYRVDGDRIVHHIELAWDQTRLDSDQVRFFSFEDDRLLLRTLVNRGPIDGKEGFGLLTFERAAPH